MKTPKKVIQWYCPNPVGYPRPCPQPQAPTPPNLTALRYQISRR